VVTTTGSLVVSPIVQSSAGQGTSWLETDLQSPQLSFDPNSDIAGPVNIGVAVAPPSPSTPLTDTAAITTTRLAVFGDVDFVANGILRQTSTYNSDMFANAVSWLAGAEELVSIRPKDPSAARTITLDTGQKNLMFTLSVLGLPILVVLAGGMVWWRRR
jgi:ABC-type uncharacterized transport system involved in gliding motility auxiliary subunit